MSAPIEVHGVTRRFGPTVALDTVSLSVHPSQIHALLGPNGAGKTTLLRIVSGLLHPDAGTVRVASLDPVRNPRTLRQRVGLVPSGDRSFYLRISGLENLAFFARLNGFSRRDAVARSLVVLEQVGLQDAARLRVAFYSHGMQKRLSVARALLTAPEILLVDEATHDLDPEGARRVRALVGEIAAAGTAVLWTTQRIEEIRGFAGRVTVLGTGTVRFVGSVPELLAIAIPRRYVLRLQNGRLRGADLERLVQDAVGSMGAVSTLDDGEGQDFLLALDETVVLGDAIAAIASARVDVLACRQEQSDIEEAFLRLTEPMRELA